MHYHGPTPSTGFHRQETTINKKFVGRYLTYPRADCVRQAEGGKRLKGVLAKSRVDEPLVTIITVCWNSARTIEQSILSVLNQTYENIEYLVIDGNSTDGTLSILRKYEAEIDYYVSELDDGLYYAMNKGLELAQGDYILLLNSDDWYAENAVERLVAAKSYSGCSFVSAQARHVDAKGQLTDVMRVMHFDYAVYLRTPLRHETMLLPCQVYDQIGPYNTDFRIISDYDYLIRLFEAGHTHYQLHEPLLMFRQTGISHTDTGKIVAEREALLAARFSFLDKRGIDLLIDRDHHSGGDLLKLASQHSGNATFVNAIHDYVRDHASIALQGRGKKAWRPHANDLLAEIKNYRETGSPLVSVILAVYNCEQTIRACIDSVLGQMFRDIELICVNDQTPDNSQAIIDEYCAKDPRVRSVINERNIGLGATRNRGIREARGSYLFHIDPDDTIPENALQVLVNYATKNDSELVRGAYLRKQFHHGSNFKPQIIHPLGKPKTLINKTLRDIPELLSTPEGHWAYLYHVDLARRVPYPENLKMGQDAIFLFSIVPVASKITVIPDVVYNYLENPASAMNVFILQKYIDVLEWRRRAICLLENCGLNDLATNLRNGIPRLHWHDRFLKFNDESPDQSAIDRLSRILRAIYKNSGAPKMDERIPERRREFLQMLFDGAQIETTPVVDVAPWGAGSRPKVSVILAVYNAEDTLRQSIDSVLSQSLQEIELICVNDRTPDGSQKIIDDYTCKDKRVVSVINDKNIGLGASRNRGIAAARGHYIFHLDPDDTCPPDALKEIHALAVRYGSDMTRGAFLHEQFLLGQTNMRKERKGLKEGAAHIVNTSLKQSPELLKSTEGHWSYLYRADFAKRVKYPEDLKMGQDSIFIVNAVVQAKSISVTDALVYHYRANPNSAMNTFNFRKFMDALEWRRRAWNVLREAGFTTIGEQLLFRYWSPAFFQSLVQKLSVEEKQEFDLKLAHALQCAGYPSSGPAKVAQVRKYLEATLVGLGCEKALTGSTKLRIATFTTQDHGGAGLGSQRRVEAIRKNGIDAHIYCAFQKTNYSYVHELPYAKSLVPDACRDKTWEAWRKASVLTRAEHPDLKARELFSKTGCIVDFRDIKPVFDKADIVHMHWVSGIFDFDHTETLADKPVAWTLADMNPFTGGCHYSEGCEGYKEECRNCPLLGDGSDLAHKAWQKKGEAYAKISNLHIICPSQWLADCVRESSLFGNRPVHMIPNALPVARFIPTNRLVARLRLGLPLGKKLVVFGADSLNNRRKGGDILAQSIRHLKNMGKGKDVECVFFGASNLDLGIKAHNMGHLSDETKLSLIYAAADVFAFPSREDNAPLTVAESMLSGTPIVAFSVGNVPELIRHKNTGFIARYEDAKDFAEGLAWAFAATRSREAISRRVRCCRVARAHNDPETAVARHLRLYNDMIS